MDRYNFLTAKIISFNSCKYYFATQKHKININPQRLLR